MEVGLHSPHPKTKQRHSQKHLIKTHIPPLSNCKDDGEEPTSLQNSKHIKHIHETRVQNTTLFSDGTAHIKQHRSKGVQPKGSPCAKNHCSTRYEQRFRHNNIHTLIRKMLHTKNPGTIIKFIVNYIKGRKAYINISSIIIPQFTSVEINAINSIQSL